MIISKINDDCSNGKDNSVVLIEAFQSFNQIYENICKEFKYVTKGEDQEAVSTRSIGSILYRNNALSSEATLKLLLREGRILRMDAQIILEILCFYRVKNYIEYRKRIVDFWKELADEGLPLARRIYGEILYNGIEVPKNVKLGLEFLKKCRRDDAYIALYKHYHYVEKDLKTSRYYLWLSIKNDYPDAIYELALAEMEAKNYDEAIKLFKKIIVLQDNHWKAKFALANIYATRCLSNIGCERMPETVKLFQEAQKDTYDEEAKQSIIERLSFIKKYYPNLF